MKPVKTFSLAVVLASVFTIPGFAVVSSEQAQDANALNRAETPGQTTTPQTTTPQTTTPQTTTPWSSTMSSPNTPSHDGNSQLGTMQQKGADGHGQAGHSTPRTSTMGTVNAPSREGDHQLGQRDSTNPAATNPGCGGAC
jgi:hypothetical protein